MKYKNQPDWTDFRNFSIPDIKIDFDDPNSYSNKILPEQESRKRILTHARLVGCEKEMMLLFAKYNKLLKACTNEKERLDIGKLAAVEVFRLLGDTGSLTVNGELVI